MAVIIFHYEVHRNYLYFEYYLYENYQFLHEQIINLSYASIKKKIIKTYKYTLPTVSYSIFRKIGKNNQKYELNLGFALLKNEKKKVTASFVIYITKTTQVFIICKNYKCIHRMILVLCCSNFFLKYPKQKNMFQTKILFSYAIYDDLDLFFIFSSFLRVVWELILIIERLAFFFMN